MKFKSMRGMKNLETAPYPKTKKKLRSELPRRRRSQISPILYSSRKFNALSETSGFSSFSMNSNSCSYFGGEVSCESSRVSVGSASEARSSLRKRQFDEIEVYGAEKVRNAPYRRVTRSCYGGKAEKKEVGDCEAEVSETSCVESNLGADFGCFVERKLKLKSKIGKGSEIVKEIGGNEGSETVTRSEISVSDRASLEFKENEVTSFNSGVELCYKVKLAEKTVNDGENRAPEFEFPEISKNYFCENFTVSNSESTIEQRPEESLQVDSDLACKENFSYDDISEYSSSQTLSELQSELFDENTELRLSDYTPSLFFDSDSGSEFSERSDEDSTPSLTFPLLLQYREGFSRSSTASYIKEVYKDHSTFLKFEDEEDEESYQLLRNRERMQVYLRDYTKEYSSTTEYGDLILHQRWQMVRWIAERSIETKLQQETKFLGVSLLDRFLSKGFFKSKRMLQIVGIASLTLASRLEENQPYNCVRKSNFSVGSNVYSRFEVVAMEWLVQEVLKFQCFLPTIYNFLWFYLKAARADAQVEKRAKYLAVLQMSDHVQLRFWPSTVAAALVILASLEGNHDESRQRVIETHVRTEGDDLHQCIQSLEWLLNYV